MQPRVRVMDQMREMRANECSWSRLPLQEIGSNAPMPGSLSGKKVSRPMSRGNITLRNRNRFEVHQNSKVPNIGSFKPVALTRKGLQAAISPQGPAISPAISPRICDQVSPRHVELESAPVLRTTPRPCDLQTAPQLRTSLSQTGLVSSPRDHSQTGLVTSPRELRSVVSCKELPLRSKENEMPVINAQVPVIKEMPVKEMPVINAQVIQEKPTHHITMEGLQEQIRSLRGEFARLSHANVSGGDFAAAELRTLGSARADVAAPELGRNTSGDNRHSVGSVNENRNSVGSVNEMIERTTRRTADLLRLGSTPPSGSDDQRSGTSTDIPRGTPRKRRGNWQAGSSSSPEPNTTDSNITPNNSLPTSEGPSPVLDDLQHTVLRVRNEAAEQYREVDHLKEQLRHQGSMLEEQRMALKEQQQEIAKLRSEAAHASALSCIDRRKKDDDEQSNWKEEYGLFGCFRRLNKRPPTPSPAKSPSKSRSRSVGYLDEANLPKPVSLSSVMQAAADKSLEDSKTQGTGATVRTQNKMGSPGPQIQGTEWANELSPSQATLSPHMIRNPSLVTLSPNVTLSPSKLSPSKRSLSPSKRSSSKRSHSSPPVPSPPCPPPINIHMQPVVPRMAPLGPYPAPPPVVSCNPRPETFSIATPLASPRNGLSTPAHVWLNGSHGHVSAFAEPCYPPSARLRTKNTPRITPRTSGLLQPPVEKLVPLPGTAGVRGCSIPSSPELPSTRLLTY